MKKAEVEKRLKDAKVTLTHLNKRKSTRIDMTKKTLIGYCNETIALCCALLELMEKEKK